MTTKHVDQQASSQLSFDNVLFDARLDLNLTLFVKVGPGYIRKAFMLF
jgi:hypothetical protein